jgi:hypothetical protein
MDAVHLFCTAEIRFPNAVGAIVNAPISMLTTPFASAA